MNIETNELFYLSGLTDEKKKKLMENPNIKLVPKKFAKEASALLGKKKRVKVPVSGNNLTNWAKKVRNNMKAT